MRKSDDADVGFREDYEEVLADVGCNTDLYFYFYVNVSVLIKIKRAQTCVLREVHTGDAASFAFHGSRPIVSISGALKFKFEVIWLLFIFSFKMCFVIVLVRSRSYIYIQASSFNLSKYFNYISIVLVLARIS